MDDRDLPAMVAAVDAAKGIAAEIGRDDLVRRLSVAIARVRRPATIVCVVGEFKQGKSSLVNALLGQAVCPVDDDIATSAITLIHYGAEIAAEVRRRVDDEVVVQSIEVAEIPDWVSERGNSDNCRGVERVDIAMPHALLADGLAIVDTPGMGGLGAGHAAATLAFLPFADGLVFVTDASAELSAAEAEFLDRAAELCPNVEVVLTKTDLYPAWRTIAGIDARRVRERPVGDAQRPRPILPVSSVLAAVDGSWIDDMIELAPMAVTADLTQAVEPADASGILALRTALQVRIVEPAKARAADRAVGEADAALDQIREQLQAELDVLDDPTRLAETVARLADATKHLEQLRGPGARWSVLVADRLSDLSSSSSFSFRKSMRTISRDLEEAIESLKTPADWDGLARRVQTDVADAVTAVFVEIERGAQATRGDVSELIGEALVEVSGAGRLEPTAVRSLWTEKGVDPEAHRGGPQLGSALVGLRGAQSGIIMFGMLGRFLPTAAAGLMLSNPVTIGIGAVFGGMQLADAHKRKIALRRQQARSNVRQFLDEVQFAIGNEISDALRAVQRAIRDEFTERVSERLRTYAEATQQAQRSAQQQGEGATKRSAAIQRTLEHASATHDSLRAATMTERRTPADALAR